MSANILYNILEMIPLSVLQASLLTDGLPALRRGHGRDIEDKIDAVDALAVLGAEAARAAVLVAGVARLQVLSRNLR